MISPTTIEARGGHRIWLRYSAGTSGETDLSYLDGVGVFKAWDKRGCFEKVRIAPYRAIMWDDDLELCPDALHLELASDLNSKGPVNGNIF